MYIEFIEKLPYPPYLLYHVKVINKGNKTQHYDMSKVTCNAGRNVLQIKPGIKLKKFELELLTQGTLKKDESIEGLICIIPSIHVATNKPVFAHEKKKIKVKIKKGCNHGKSMDGRV